MAADETSKRKPGATVKKQILGQKDFDPFEDAENGGVDAAAAKRRRYGWSAFYTFYSFR